MSYIFRKSLYKRQEQDEDRSDKMSTGFSAAYYDILARDLRHVYSGVSPSEIKFRTMAYHHGIDIIDRLREQRKRPDFKIFPRKYLEYLETYDICIPRAPAFRNLSKVEIDNMVYRLNSKQTSLNSHHQKSHERQERSQLHSAPAGNSRRVDRLAEERIRKTAIHKQELKSKEYMKAVVERLYQGQTLQSKLRQREAVLEKRCKSAPAAGARAK